MLPPPPAPASLFLPALAMVALTVAVTFRMFFERVRQMRSHRIAFREIPSSSQMAARLADTRAADNYRNLFEAPVLFYAAMLTGVVLHAATLWLVTLAWIYVALRYVHSYIHCTYNRVMHRFAVFGLSMFMLVVIWGTLAWQIVRLVGR